ncbi:IS3 family transposase [Tardiphaga sp. vice352]|uniref:IS3 family transposase n=1 Tax=unclassified Tardiphaga TaxID=2631404 RepID=UPI00116518D4|nr:MULTISPECIES: IS3 family transposase [unclassified Tardiphaga]QDM15428.1 IS3 family transposase [Tardiphaga sp. vice278]QDM25577.1 IS3 family transposase [Tardiphaga sp. vice304]QDM30786.1 IS3 family transposase [Tardiphaga sp. vice352]
MTRRPRRNHTPGFKAKVALAAIKGDRTITQLAEHFDVHPNQITTWKAQLEGAASGVFGPGGTAPTEPAVDVKSLHAKIGELTLENGFFRRRAHQGGIAERKTMIDRNHDLSITKQTEVLKISRGSVYYLPRPVSATDLAIMQRLDRLHLEFPFAGSRMLRGLLAAEGCQIGRRHVKTLMKRMGIEAIYRRPRTTKPEPGHKIYPYLLRGMEITRPNHVWATDITYIPMARGFVYLAVVLDWATRRVLSWRLSITMEASFCIETLQDALARHGKPEIFNTDQGSQFTGQAFTGLLADNGIAISMDGKGACRDNVFVERLWRSVKYEEVYLRAYDSVDEARQSIGRYLDFYNGRRPHSSLDGRTPDQAYFNPLPIRMAA